jgi:hypothetical protein
MKRKVWLAAGAAVVAAMLAIGAASGQIYDQKYVVEAIITPLDAEQPAITTSEVWETVAYRDSTRFHTVVRVFGEALHFEFGGDDYFLLKRGVNNSSAGPYDPLAECFGIRRLADYGNAPELTADCRITARTLMVVRVDDAGRIERINRPSSADPYPEFAVEFVISPTRANPHYDLTTRFPWIAELPEHEPSTLPVKIPEEGPFSMSKHYQKDFVVRP